jgi:hypothetical protein
MTQVLDVKRIVSEDAEKIIAFTILVFAYISVPVFLIVLLILGFLDLRYILRFILGGSSFDLVISIFLSSLIIVILLGLRSLIRWLKE